MRHKSSNWSLHIKICFTNIIFVHPESSCDWFKYISRISKFTFCSYKLEVLAKYRLIKSCIRQSDFGKSFWWGHWYSCLDFQWCLRWVTKRGWMTDSSDSHQSVIRSADLLTGSMEAEPLPFFKRWDRTRAQCATDKRSNRLIYRGL